MTLEMENKTPTVKSPVPYSLILILKLKNLFSKRVFSNLTGRNHVGSLS